LKLNGSVHVAAVSPAGRLVVTAGNDGTARLWAVAPEKHAQSVGKQDYPRQAAKGKPGRWVSPDGRRLVTAERHHGAQVRDGATDKPLGPLLRHGSSVLQAAFSPDGRRLVTASDDNTARIWDPATGELVTQPLKHRGTVRFADFSGDSRLVVTVGDDNTARVWDAGTGQALTPPLKFAGGGRSAFFSADGTRVNVAGTEQTVWTWDLHPDDRPAADLVSLAQVLAGSRVDPTRGYLPLDADTLRHTWQRLRARYPNDFKPDDRLPIRKP
jgi:WD40 repeat protein